VGKSLKVMPTKSRDQFTGKCPPNCCGIANLDKSDGAGTHFTLYMRVGPHAYYFDSYGVLPPTQLQAYLARAGQPLAYSASEVQPIGTATCGYYCVYTAAQTLKSSFYDALESFSLSPEQNELLLKRYFSRGHSTRDE
jgi:hypothetical protein